MTTPKQIPSVNIDAGRFGFTFYCSECGYEFEDETEPGALIHPKDFKLGLISRRVAINCSQAGKKFKNPMLDIPLNPL